MSAFLAAAPCFAESSRSSPHVGFRIATSPTGLRPLQLRLGGSSLAAPLPAHVRRQWCYEHAGFSLYALAGRGRPPARGRQVSRGRPRAADDDVAIPWNEKNKTLLENFLQDLGVTKADAPTADDFKDPDTVINLNEIEFDEDDEEDKRGGGWFGGDEDEDLYLDDGDDDQFEISFEDVSVAKASERPAAPGKSRAERRAALQPGRASTAGREAAPAPPQAREARGRPAPAKLVCEFKSAKYVKSAMSKQEWPVPRDRQKRFLPEVAVLGHANAGKSSLLNDLWNKPGLAQTSSVPGCTRALDFFDVDSLVSLVDVPGYGFSVVPEEERLRWPEMFADYFGRRKQLKVIMFVVDMCHEIVIQDKAMRNYIEMSGKPGLLVLTKADLVPKAKREERARQIMQAVKWDPRDPYLFYCVKGGSRTGRDEVIAQLNAYLFEQRDPKLAAE